MKIIVLGGSPKGKVSVTMQYVEYLKRCFTDVEFDVRQPAFNIVKLERNHEAFDELTEAIRRADGVLWAFPLYFHSVCGQYHRFIELIDERDAGDAFTGKPAAALSTSIHFFDNTAHDYIRETSEDMGLDFVTSHSAKMDDLTRPEGRKSLKAFFSSFLKAFAEYSTFPIRTGKRITILADTLNGGLGPMVDRFRSVFADDVQVISLDEVDIAGGCLGCLKCGPKNRCVYDGKDGVRDVYERFVEPADLYVMAATVQGRWYSSRMKMFVDRGFFHTHQPFLVGKQAAVILDGPAAGKSALRDGLEGLFEWQGASLNGIASNSGNVELLARRCADALETGYVKPATFLGVAGLKVFRDDIYTHLRMVFRADHLSYRKSGLYSTLPHKKPLKMLMFRIIGFITALPPVQKRLVSNMKNLMVMPYRAALAKAGSNKA